MMLRGFGSYDFPETPKGYLPICEGTDVVRANLLMLLNSSHGERVMMPEYGANLRKFLFNPNTAEQRAGIRSSLLEAIERWDDSIVVDALEVDETPQDDVSVGDDAGHTVWIRILYRERDDLSAQQILDIMLPIS